VERHRSFVNRYPKCEPQLGKRGLYASGQTEEKINELAMLWILNLSDDNRVSLLDIAEESGIEFAILKRASDRLLEHGLLTNAE
jgi:aminopeptidase-like protein